MKSFLHQYRHYLPLRLLYYHPSSFYHCSCGSQPPSTPELPFAALPTHVREATSPPPYRAHTHPSSCPPLPRSAATTRYHTASQTLSTVEYFDDTSIFTGFFSDARWSFATFVVIVAENKYVLRSIGISRRIFSIFGPKSISSSRSASSITKYLSVFSENPLVFSKWSCNLPGVHTTICGFFESAIACVTISIPPTITAHRAPMVDPNASNVSAI
ncbi:hypothetical protein AX774_g4126 [Zancudomyces culisetae]|uniref:Uncharacterized protein n=1 Tax=Zancudomyces culisetae TaxID=1213189 RepID=A0A1R1PN47_ZANCU|nr:hypothetical protein AX774_g4126 [Zancudomyces culisetae]|eukprot:OMH82387.1 hypothetical protein AX774_g4126 [Zancudomyces culisetae]